MKKNKTGRLCLLLAAILPALLLSGYWLRQRVLEEQAKKEAWLQDHFYFETLTFLESGGADGTQVRGWRDWVGDRLYVFLPSYAAGKPLLLDWDYADRLLIDGEEVKKKRGRAERLFTLDQEYVFSFCSADKTELESCKVVFLCSQNLPALFIETESGSIQQVQEDKTYEEPGSMVLVGADGQVSCMELLTYIRGRGNTTWNQSKKPYDIKLRADQDLLGMGSAKRWALLANAYDGSHMRNQLMFELAQQAGLAYTPQAAWVDLYVDGVYQGLYQLAEKVQVQESRVDIPDQQKGQGDESGGYLLLMEDGSRSSVAVSSFTTSGGQNIVLKSPEPAGEEQMAYITGRVQAFEDAVTSPDGINPETGRPFTDYIDLDSFAKKYLLEEIAKNSDAVTNSQYFYKQPDAVSPLLFAGPVWDYDNAFGHTNEEAMRPTGLMLDKIRSENGQGNLWYGSLCSQPVFTERVEALWAEQLGPVLRELTEHRLESWREQLRVSATLDWIRWKDVNKDFRYKVCDSFDAYVDYLQWFLRERIAFLDSVYIRHEAWRSVRFDRGYPFGFVDFYVKEGENGLQPPDNSDIVYEGKHITGWYYEDGTPYDSARPVIEDIKVTAGWEPVEAEETKGE